jgi:hypothetical protein
MDLTDLDSMLLVAHADILFLMAMIALPRAKVEIIQIFNVAIQE